MLLSKGLCADEVLSLHFDLDAFVKELKESMELAADFTDAIT